MIGAGNIAEFHVAAVKKLAPEVELVGVCDSTLRARRRTPRSGGTTAYKDLDALVAAGANVIHVLTPPSSHAKLATLALERGCHVLIEKPVAEDADDARKVAELAAAKGLTVSVNHSLLYDPQVKRALDAVKSGALGNVVSVDILRGSEYRRTRAGRCRRGTATRATRSATSACTASTDPGAARPDRGGRRRLALARRRSEPRVRRVARDGCAARAASASSSSRGTRSRCSRS